MVECRPYGVTAKPEQIHNSPVAELFRTYTATGTATLNNVVRQLWLPGFPPEELFARFAE